MDQRKIGETIREQEYKSGTMFAGTLRNLIERRALPKQRSVIDWHSCSLTLAFNTLAMIADSVIIYHSPPGCIDSSEVGYFGGKSKGIEQRNPFQWEMKNIHFCHSNMDESSIIFGGEEKLLHAVREAKARYNPRLITVLGSCTSAIIGDDIDAVCRKAEEEMNGETYVVPVHAQGFQTISWTNSFDIVWEKIIERIVKPPQQRRENIVNVFMPFTSQTQDKVEIERLLNAMELEAQFIPDLTSVETLEQMAESALTTAMCKCYAYHAMRLLNERFRMPVTKAPFLIGVEYTTQWLREVGELTGRKDLAETVIREELERIGPELNDLRRKLTGKTAYISANHAKTLGYVRMCNDLGMTVAGAGFHMVDDISREHEEQVLKDIGDLNVAVGSPIYEEMNHLARLRPDVVLAHGEIAPLFSAIGIGCKQTYNYSNEGPHVCFQGILEIGRSLHETIVNPMRNKILKYRRHADVVDFTQIPYLEEEDTFRFVHPDYRGFERGGGCRKKNAKRCGSL